MGHHLTDDGQFKSDRHPDLPAGKIVLSFRDPHAQLGLWVTAIDYRAHDPELSADMVTALSRLGSAPPRAAVEDAWAWALAREQGLDPRETVRVFAYTRDDGVAVLRIVGSETAVLSVQKALFVSPERVATGHVVTAETDAPPRGATDDGRPDFDGFLLALRAEGHWSAALHDRDETGQAAADQRALHALAQHVEAVGRALGFLPVTRTPGEPQGRDWTTGDDGLANSSALFRSLEKRVAAIIVDSARSLLPWHTERVAGLILAELAHEHGLSPRGTVAFAPKAASVTPPRTRELAERPSPHARALAEWLRHMANIVEPEGGGGIFGHPMVRTECVDNLRAAADALERGVSGASLEMMEAHDAPLLAPDKP